jgi:hypothetical protein
MTAQQIETIIVLLCAMGSLVVATGTLVWFMADQFKKNRAEFWKGITSLHNTMTARLDDHDKKDDRRFDRMTDELWDIKLRNARKDGDPLPPRPLQQVI